MRRTVATGLQRLGVRLEVTEAVLNHISGSRAGIAGVYQRHDWAAEKPRRARRLGSPRARRGRGAERHRQCRHAGTGRLGLTQALANALSRGLTMGALLPRDEAWRVAGRQGSLSEPNLEPSSTMRVTVAAAWASTVHAMLTASKIALPYEPSSTANRDAERRRQQTREWLAQRERELASGPSPSIQDDGKSDEEA